MLAKSVAESFKAFRDVKEFGIVADGSTGISTNLNNAINTLSTAGGGWLVFPPNTNAYCIDATITLKKKVYLNILPGATLKWTGTAGGTMFTTPNDRVLVYAGIGGGGVIDMQNASYGWDFHSHQVCYFNNITFIANDVSTTYSLTSTVIKMVADSSATTDAHWAGLKNIAANCYESIYQGSSTTAATACGNFLHMEGTTNYPVTLNTFTDIMAHNVRVKGIDFVQWVDNNHFTGSVRLNMYGNNAVGVDHNSFSPSSEAQVYLNNFYDLAVDTFDTYTGRIGIRFGYTRHNTVLNYYNQMADVGGASIQDNYSQSHYIVFHDYDMVGKPIRLVSKNLSGFGGTMTVRDIDGSPSYASITTLEFNNGSVTNPSAGVARVNISVGDIDGGAFSDTYINTADIDGGAF